MEFCQCCPRILLGLSKQSRQVCVCVCLCVCVCVCLCVCVCVRARADHKSTAVNIYGLNFLIDNNNIVIKPRILKINLSRLKN